MKRWILGGSAALLLLVYLLRWPLFGGLIVSKLPPGIHVGEWSGSILRSVQARDVTIDGYGTIEEIEAAYSPLDLSTLDVTITGADIRLPKSGAPKKLSQQIHEGLEQLRKLKIPGRVKVRRSTLEGIEITSAEISDEWRANGSAGSLHFEASKDSDGTIRVRLQTEGSLEYAFAEIKLDGSIQAQALRPPYFVRFEGRLDHDTLSGTARVNSEFTAGARLDLNSETIHIDASGILPVAHVGNFEVDATVQGSLREPPTRWRAETIRATSRDAVVGGVRIDRISFEGRGSIESGFPVKLIARKDKDQLDASGHLQSFESIDLAATLKVKDVGRYVEKLRGPLCADARLRRRQNLTEITIDPCVMPMGDPILIRGRATHDGRIWRLHSLNVRYGVESLTLSGRMDHPKNFSLKVELDGTLTLDAQAARTPDVLQVSGKARYRDASMEFDAQARSVKNLWTIALAPTEIRMPERRIRIVNPLVVLASPKAITLSPTSVEVDNPAIRTRLSGTWADGLRLQADPVHIAGHDLPPLIAEWSPKTVNIQWGEFLQARGTPENWSGRFEIKDLARFFPIQGSIVADAKAVGTRLDGRIELKQISITGEEPFDLTIPIQTRDGVVHIESSRAMTALGPLTIGGTLSDLSLTLVIHKWEPILRRLPEDVRPWIPLTPVWMTIHVTNGSVHAHVSMPSDFRFPRILGTLSNFEATVALRGTELIVQKIDGRLEGGPFHIEGRWSPESMALTLTGTSALAFQTDSVRVRVSPNLTVTTMEDGRYLVKGQIEVPLALYYEAFRPSSKPGTREISVSGITLERHPSGGYRIPGIVGLNNVVLNLAVRTPGEVRIENNTIGTLLGAEVWLRGTADDPAISGTIIARKGEIRLMTGMFMDIRKAAIVLPLEPAVPATIDFEGRVGSGESAITIRVSGRLESPQLALSSESSRSQNELLSQLAFNRLPGAVGQAETLGVVGTQVAGELFRRYVDDWPRADRKRGFFEQLRFSLRQEEQLQTRVPPWQLPPVGSARGTLLRTEFVITSSLSIVVESNVEGNFSGDVKYRFRF